MSDDVIIMVASSAKTPTTAVKVRSTVFFREGAILNIGIVSGIRDYYHLTLLLNDGRQLTNVPHFSRNPYIGWYSQYPSETLMSGYNQAYTVMGGQSG